MLGKVSISGTPGSQSITDQQTLARRDAVTKREFSAALFAHLFPAPFMIFVWPDGAELNEELRPRILEHASRSAGSAEEQRRRLALRAWPTGILRRPRATAGAPHV